MEALKQVQETMNRAWDNLAVGWREMRHRAAHALTRFDPLARRGTFETFHERQAARGLRWGMLAADVSDDDDMIEVTLEAPGLEPDDFEIDVVGDRLRVRGEKRLMRETRRGAYCVMERAYGKFERWVPLPTAVDDSRAEAQYRNGVLRITLPKLRTGPVHRIRVAKS